MLLGREVGIWQSIKGSLRWHEIAEHPSLV
jgi:hypothetical protein